MVLLLLLHIHSPIQKSRKLLFVYNARQTNKQERTKAYQLQENRNLTL